MRKISYLFVLILVLSSCSTIVSNREYFLDIEPTNDSTYGYSPENPIPIENGSVFNSINTSYYFMSRLRTQKGNRLTLISSGSVYNPNYKKPAIELTNRYSGENLNNGNGRILDEYILKPENEKDTTISLYFNVYIKRKVKIPMGLHFIKE